ncbi:MAG TPA: S53 family peptidase [Fimbriimonadaceae bacterium]|nr:S53 family peptidase [Fimbriimonadaceae bacterium]
MLSRRLLLAAPLALAANPAWAGFDGSVFVPRSSMEHAWDIGERAHTNHVIYVGPEYFPSRQDAVLAELFNPGHGPSAPPNNTPAGYHPSDFQRAYGDFSLGGGVIAIVDAYHFPTALNDFNAFATQFGLPTEGSSDPTLASNPVFQVVYANGSQPGADGGWSQEMALDIEWAHAMAPGAKIVLVEAASSGFTDLFHAVDVAAALPGVTQVSLSWGGSEFPGEAMYDSHFNHAGVSFFAATGDVGGSRDYPAMSPHVVAVGGTSLTFPNGAPYERGWSGAGGGLSQAERMPGFQGPIMSILYGRRGAPDISAVADPGTGAAIYDSTAYQGFVGWYIVGGTSLSCPVCAGVANAGGGRRGANEQAYIYSHASGFSDVVSGGAGANLCRKGWDFVTGFGSPKSSSSL